MRVSLANDAKQHLRDAMSRTSCTAFYRTIVQSICRLRKIDW